MARPILLDLFCGAGGAARGYEQAGFDVVGVDIRPQPNYPYEFHQHEAVDLMRDWLKTEWRFREFAAIHASPPCQAFTAAQNARKNADYHVDLITPIRPLLVQSGLPYVIENVLGAPLHYAIRVCMSQHLRHEGFELRRHRWFETNWPCHPLSCGCGELPAAPVFGHSAGADFRKRYGRDFGADDRRAIMQVPWMTRDEAAEAVPPAFTEYIGEQLMREVIV